MSCTFIGSPDEICMKGYKRRRGRRETQVGIGKKLEKVTNGHIAISFRKNCCSMKKKVDRTICQEKKMMKKKKKKKKKLFLFSRKRMRMRVLQFRMIAYCAVEFVSVKSVQMMKSSLL
jgi:hypothetical protein